MESSSRCIGIDDDYPKQKYFFDNINYVRIFKDAKILAKHLQLETAYF
ncbi:MULTISPECIES: hypothetical protein [Clostridium]|nr:MULTISPECIES: hypothetical protein [Clostridium]